MVGQARTLPARSKFNDGEDDSVNKGERIKATKTRTGRKWSLLLTSLLFCATQPVALAQPPNEDTLQALMASGKEVYERTCVVCHQINGKGLSGAFPPLVAGARFDAGPSVIKPLEKLGLYQDGAIALGSLETHIDVVVNGIPGTRMFAFGPQLSDEDIAAVVTYIRNAWGNDTGDTATPEQVKKARKK